VNIHQFSQKTVEDALQFINGLNLTEQQQTIVTDVVREIRSRLQFLAEVGLGYLTLDRESGTLSGGEAQRIRLATQIGSGLAGVLYILDEPSIGLHQRDNARLLGTLRKLRDLGNSVIVVEHDEETIRAADHIIDLGPGAGPRGGEIVAQGTLDHILRAKNSLTGDYLSGRARIAIPKQRAQPRRDGWITVARGNENNLKNIDASFPLGCLTCVTGVSGSGKSTLVDVILRRALFRHFYNSKDKPGAHETIRGLEQIDKAVVIDQTPIGRTPRSNPVTYTGAFTPIRELFAQLPAARIRGYDAGRFSFNVKGGRCENCEGGGLIKIEMHFLPDVYVECEVCRGKRYNRETLEITYKGKNIADVLDLTVDEAARFFRNVPTIAEKLNSLLDVGLGYLRLGQAGTTLSGGEAQRVKLATELAKKATGRTVYILDEPTTGLHFADIEKLLEVLMKLRNAGNTIVVIEHNLEMIKCADWIIDLGPEGGESGGQLVGVGSPEVIATISHSHTGKYLRQILGRR
jgi:excinuclease ABC subunit A